MNDYRKGYYDGFLACLAAIDKLSTLHIQQMEGEYVMDDGSLYGDAVCLAYGYAEETCERYAYGPLQDWMAGYSEEKPVMAENIVEEKP